MPSADANELLLFRAENEARIGPPEYVDRSVLEAVGCELKDRQSSKVLKLTEHRRGINP
jgi:hypothetical protein